MAGWTEEESGVSAIFEAIPALESVLAWDPDTQWFSWTARDGPGTSGHMEVLKPGMGLWLYIGGAEPTSWTRPVVAAAALIEVREGWNLVAWGGADGMPVEEARSERSASFEEVWGWDSATQQLVRLDAKSPAGTQALPALSQGGAIWIRSSAQTRWLQTGWVQPEIVFFEDVPASGHAPIREGLQQAQRYQAEHYGVITSDFTLYVGEHYASIADAYREHFGTDVPPSQCATAWGRAIFVTLSTCVNTKLAHEYFHVVQQYLSGHNYRGTPAWLFEGSAEYVESKQIELLGAPPHYRVKYTPDTNQDIHLRWSGVGRPLTDYADESLTALERLRLTYEVGFLAAEWLVAEAGRESFIDYFRLLASRGSWQEAFAQAFGMSSQAFYEAFEAHRVEVAPPFDKRIQGTVLSSDGQPVEAVRLFVTVRVDDGSLEVLQQPVTDESGRFDFIGPGTNFFFILSADCANAPLLTPIGGYGDGGLTDARTWRDTPAFAGADEDRTGITIELPMTLAEYNSRFCRS